MSASYSITPLKKNTVEWLGSVGLEVPPHIAMGRLPTLKEIRIVLRDLKGYSIDETNKNDDLFITISDGAEPDKGLWTLMIVRKEDEKVLNVGHEIYFERGWVELILEITAKLSSYCGSLVLIPSSGKPPVLVTEDIDIEAVLKNWQQE